jgi:Fe-S cluster assembly protein SufD
MVLQVAPEALIANTDVAPPLSSSEKRQQCMQALLAVAQASPAPLLTALLEQRQQAAEQLKACGIPSTGEEDWRFTDLSPLLEIPLAPASAPSLGTPDLAHLVLPEVGMRLVFVNGRFAPELSYLVGLPQGVQVGDFNSVSPEILSQHVGQVGGGDERFTGLNTAGLTTGAAIIVPAGLEVRVPIHLLFLSVAGETPSLVQPRCLVLLGHHASLSLVEDYATVGSDCVHLGASISTFCNAVTEVILGEGAQLRHTRIQREGGKEVHIGKTAVSQARDSRYEGVAVTIGGRISRHNWEVYHQGEAVETILDGLTLATDEQLADTHSAIYYAFPHCRSRQLHKCIADGRSRVVFNGKVDVPQAAQLTDAAQLNRNLILSPKARVDTKPELEIVADNVKCSHGATVSQLEEDELFYLQSRGLDRQAATKLLIDAFAGEILQKLPVPSLREVLSRCVSCRT